MEEPEELVRRASRGEREALQSLLERHLPRLRAYVRLRMAPDLRAKESASDLVQSTCREVLEHMDRFQYGGETNFRHWLFATAFRKIQKKARFYRARRRDVAREVAPESSADASLLDGYRSFSTASRALIQKEQIEQLESAMERLSESHREALLLSRVVGLPLAAVAETLGKSADATRSLLRRALAELAEAMDQRE